MLHDQDPNLNETALKENAGLRVDKVSLQRDLVKIQKQLARSERDAESLRKEFQDRRAAQSREATSHGLDIELNTLKENLKLKDQEVKQLQELNRTANDNSELQKLRDRIEDLEADLREKDRVIESKEDDLDIANIKLRKQEDVAEQEMESAEEIKKLEAAVELLEGELMQSRDGSARLRQERDEADDERKGLMQELHQACIPKIMINRV